MAKNEPFPVVKYRWEADKKVHVQLPGAAKIQGYEAFGLQFSSEKEMRTALSGKSARFKRIP